MGNSTEPQNKLFRAIIEDDSRIVEEAIREGADANGVDPLTGRTPLYAACSSNRIHAIESLLRHGADPNKRLTYRSPVDKRVENDVVALHYVSSPEAAKAMLKAGANVNLVDANGGTALTRAASNGHLEVVKTLLASGASLYGEHTGEPAKTACMALKLVDSKIELWKKLNAKPRQQIYEEIRRILVEAESRASVASA